MTALDILVLIAVGGAAALGFTRGFVTETLSLGAWILAILAIRLLHEPATELLTAPVGTAGGAAVLAFALIFGVVFFAGRMAANAVGRRTRQSALGAFDRVLGLGFGALKGLLMAAVAFLGVTLVIDTVNRGPANRPEWMTESHSYPLLDAVARSLSEFVESRRNGGRPANAAIGAA